VRETGLKRLPTPHFQYLDIRLSNNFQTPERNLNFERSSGGMPICKYISLTLKATAIVPIDEALFVQKTRKTLFIEISLSVSLVTLHPTSLLLCLQEQAKWPLYLLILLRMLRR